MKPSGILLLVLFLGAFLYFTGVVTGVQDFFRIGDNLDADLKDQFPLLRDSVPSNIPVKSGCNPQNLPVSVLFDYTVRAGRPYAFGPLSVGNPSIDSVKQVNQGILSDWFGASGVCEYYVTRSPVGDVLYQRSVKVSLFDEEKLSGRVSYTVPDNNCDGLVDFHDVVLYLCCQNEGEDPVSSFDTVYSDKCILHTYGFTNGVRN